MVGEQLGSACKVPIQAAETISANSTNLATLIHCVVFVIRIAFPHYYYLRSHLHALAAVKTATNDVAKA